VLDHTILPRRVHALQDEQHGPSLLRVKLVLQVSQLSDARLKRVLRIFFGTEFARVPGIEILQPKMSSILDPIRFSQSGQLLHRDLHLEGARCSGLNKRN